MPYLILALVWLLCVFTALAGYVMNIMSLVALLGGEITTLFLARCLGLFFFPLGVVLGWAV